MIPRILLLLLISMLACASADELPAPDFVLPIPDGWRTETIPFPLDFAPGLDYEGLEELRFAQGMFEPEQDDFWTYAFVWWIAPGAELTPENLARDLVVYFEGLTAAVVGDGEIDTSDAKFFCKLAWSDPENGDRSSMEGEAVTFDPFASHQNVTLKLRVRLQPCFDQERLAVIFELSPKPRSHPVWSDLDSISDGFHCSSDRPQLELTPLAEHGDYVIEKFAQPPYPEDVLESGGAMPAAQVKAAVFVNKDGDVTDSHIVSNTGDPAFADAVLSSVKYLKVEWKIDSGEGRWILLLYNFKGE